MRLQKKEAWREWHDFRHQLHSFPELSGKEFVTAQKVVDALVQPDTCWTGVGGTGVVARYDSGRPGPVTMLRAELDALPIQEWADAENRPHMSAVPGHSHACGHDGHATILCAVAESLGQERPRTGQVLLLWQPAEENGRGAPAVMADERWGREIPTPDMVFALHNLPGIPLGEVVTRPGAFTAAVRSVIVDFHGKTSHAAEPEHGVNPAKAMAEMTLELLRRARPDDPNRPDFSVVTPIHAEMGEVAYGVSAGAGALRFTIRTWDETQMASWVEATEVLAQTLARAHGLKVACEWTEIFQANQNHPAAVQLVEAAADDLRILSHRTRFPFKWGEDFGVFTQSHPGAMFGLGAGETVPALHNPDYDFPDALIERGTQLFLSILNQRHA